MAGFSVRSRRRWTAAEKRRIVGESFAAGATVADVARRHGLSPAQLYNWRRETGSARIPTPGVSGFVPVVVETGSGPEAGSAAPSVIEIVAGSITVRLDAGADAAILDRVMAAARRLA